MSLAFQLEGTSEPQIDLEGQCDPGFLLQYQYLEIA